MKILVFWVAMRRRWDALKPGEQYWMAGTAWVLAAVLVVLVLMAPALRTLEQAEALQRTLNAQLSRMQSMQVEALALKSESGAISTPGTLATADEARLALENSVKQALGAAATISVSGDLATLTLRNAKPDAFAAWLALARTQARTLPIELHLTRHPGTPAATDPSDVTTAAKPAAAPAVVGWDGTVVLKLPTENLVSAQATPQ